MRLRNVKSVVLTISVGLLSQACSGEDAGGTDELPAAFAKFDAENTVVYLEGDMVVIETNGLPNHTSPYWGEGHELYEPQVEGKHLTPATILTRGDASATMRVPISPTKAATTTATTLGTIGFAISGAAIFNDQEGNGPLGGAADGLDVAGGHIGPGVYHYHTEPKPMSNDDDQLIGVLADGFLIYGRKCESTGTYPTNLDSSGGHEHATQYTDESQYHYHIKNELYLDEYYILFGSPFQGTPSAIN